MKVFKLHAFIRINQAFWPVIYVMKIYILIENAHFHIIEVFSNF